MESWRKALRFGLLAICGGFYLASVSAKNDPEAQRDFGRARKLLQDGNESQAMVSFTDFLRRHRRDLLADDAQFYLAEIYFLRRNFETALVEFKKVYGYQRGRGDRVPDAGVRIGECYDRMGKRFEAKVEWEAVIRRFPKGPAASRAQSLLDGLLAHEAVKRL